MNTEEVKDKLSVILAEEFEIDPTVITPEAPLMSTLNLDSLDLVDMVVLIDKNFGVTLTGPDFVNVVTFQDFFNMIVRKMDEKK
ncbi:MAG: phosphopantetheine-binding protein [Bacteroidales bacterium]|jgi:acyl carrier protein|nr:phosphopantetheine-binding protein [Bacteroidales bacterium]